LTTGVVRRAVEADRSAVIKTLTSAFARDAIVRFLFADDATFEQRAAAFFGHYFDVRLTGGEVFVAYDGAGASLWNPPGGNRLGRDVVDEHWERHVVASITSDEVARYEAFTKVLDAMTPDESHWYLGLLGTSPDRQRTGIARALLEHGLAIADRDGIPTFLETGMPGNVAFYRTFGFDIVAEADVQSGPTVWGLLRPPS
jgi:GNAT superfamily N-acetyltransferase